MPAFNGKVMQAAKQEAASREQQEPKKQKRSLLANMKKYKWWWIGSIFPVFAILLFMVLSVGHNNVRVPNVTNMSEVAAKASLQESGLVIGSVVEKNSSEVKKGKVISTTPPADSPVSRGHKVSLVISKGPVLTKVPDVEGTYVNAAKQKLTKLGFKVKVKEAPSNEYYAGLVMSQSVKAGSKIDAKKQAITLIVSAGFDQEESRPTANSSKKASSSKASFKLADLTGKSLEEAQDYAKAKGLALKVTKDHSDSVASGKIISTDPDAGSSMKEGDSLAVTVSEGEENKTFSVAYKAPASEDNDDSSSASSSSSQGNHIRIYIQDDDHSLGNIYRDQYITKDTDFTITFNVTKGDGKIKIMRDDDTVVDETVAADESGD